MGCGASTVKGQILLQNHGSTVGQGKGHVDSAAHSTQPASGTPSPLRSNPVDDGSSAAVEIEEGHEIVPALEGTLPACPPPCPETSPEVPTQEAPPDVADGNEPKHSASPRGSGASTPGTEQGQHEQAGESPGAVTAAQLLSSPLPSRPPSSVALAAPPPPHIPTPQVVSGEVTDPTTPISTADSFTAVARPSDGAGPALSAIPAAAPSVKATAAVEATTTSTAVAMKGSNSAVSNAIGAACADAPPAAVSTTDAARPNLTQPFSAYHVWQTMCVAGLATNVTELASEREAPGVAAELVDLWRVWREEWYGFPSWGSVVGTRNTLLEYGLWTQLSTPQRRMMCEYMLFNRQRASKADCTLLLERCTLRCRSAASASGEQPVVGHTAGQARGAQPQPLVREQAEQPPVTLQSGPTEQGERLEHWQAPPGVQDPTPPDPHAALVAACCTLPGSDTPCEAALRHFPATFVTDEFLTIFALMHDLSYVPEGPSSYSSPGNLPSLKIVAGRTHNLTVRQVWKRVVAPALEATGGMSYAEAFLSLAKAKDKMLRDVYSDLHLAVGSSTGAIKPREWQVENGRLPERHAVMVPPSPERWDGDFMHLLTGLQDAYPPHGHVCFWVDLFCSATGPPHAAVEEAATTAAAAALARCKAVAVLAPALGWPLAAPPAVSSASTISAVLDPVRQHGLPAMVLRMRPPVEKREWMPNFERELAEQERCFYALEAAEDPPPLWAQQLQELQRQQSGDGRGQGAPAGESGDNGSASGENGACRDGCEGGAGISAEEAGPISGLLACEAAVRQLWRIYREGAMRLAEADYEQYQKQKKKILWYAKTRPAEEAEMREVAAEEDSDAACIAAALGPPYGDAVIRITRVARLEGVPAEPAPDDGDGKARQGKAQQVEASVPPVVLAESVLDEQLLRCPAGMTQAEADELVRVWLTEWACTPDLSTVLLTRAACSGGHGAGGSNSGGPSAEPAPAVLQGPTAAAPPNLWASMTYGQRRTACELLLLYGSRTAAAVTAMLVLGDISPADKSRKLPPRPQPTVPAAVAACWRPSAEAEAEARAASSRGAFVTADFLRHFLAMHDLPGGRSRMTSYPGQAVWNPFRHTSDVTTSWVCANIVLPATQGYGMGYSDLLLAAEAQAALLRPVRDGKARRFCLGPDEAQERAFASHAWSMPFTKLTSTLMIEPKNAYWIDIFQKNQHQSVAISDLADNLRLSGQVALVIHPFPQPLVLSRVWCLFEIMTALQVGVPVSLFRSADALKALEQRLTTDMYDNAPVEITPEVVREVEAIDVASAQATVAADKELILGMIRDGIGVEEMNRRVRELVMKLLDAVREEVKAKQVQNINNMCFGGDGLVRVPAAPLLPPLLRRPSRNFGQLKRRRERARAGTATARVASAAGVPTGGPGGASGSGDGGSALSLRRVADLRPGDTVVTAAGGLSRVVLVTRDEVGPEGVELCAIPCGDGGAGTATGRGWGDGGSGAASALEQAQEGPAVGGGHSSGSGWAVCSGGASAPPPGWPAPPAHLLVTADHPVLREGVWVLPRSVARVERRTREQVPYGAVYNLELDPPAPLLVSGVVLVALGQDISGQPGVGVTPESCRLYGWGWRSNPQREQYVREQQMRQEWREGQQGWKRLPLPMGGAEGQGGSGERGVGQRKDARGRAV